MPEHNNIYFDPDSIWAGKWNYSDAYSMSNQPYLYFVAPTGHTLANWRASNYLMVPVGNNIKSCLKYREDSHAWFELAMKYINSSLLELSPQYIYHFHL